MKFLEKSFDGMSGTPLQVRRVPQNLHHPESLRVEVVRC